MTTPNTVREINGGVQHLYSFPNGRGASVVKGPDTYGGPEGKWELAVLVDAEEGPYIDYSTPLTSDVLGYLSDEEVEAYLKQIQNLPTVERA